MKFFYLLLSVFLLYTLQWNTFVDALSTLRIRTKIPLDISDFYNRKVPLKNCRYYLNSSKVYCEMAKQPYEDYYIIIPKIPIVGNHTCKITDKSILSVDKLLIGGKKSSDIAYIPMIQMIKGKKEIYPRSGKGELILRDTVQDCNVNITYFSVYIGERK